MSARLWYAWAIVALAAATSAACRHAPQPEPPADSLLDAVRADERQGNLSYAESQGKRLFIHYCETCHGEDGKADGQNASNLSPPPPDMTVARSGRDAASIRRAIAQGSTAIGRSPLSPPWGRSLSPQQIDYLVAYCESLGREKH